MAIIIGASINLKKIDKSKIIEGKDGAKYYNFDISVNDTKDKFGNDVSIMDKQTKEQRTMKEKRVYLGNGRIIWEGGAAKKEPDNKTEEWRMPDSDNNGPTI